MIEKTLVIISCSKRKKETKDKIKAWDLYDGVIYRLLKKNNINFRKFEVRIISAKYGLISCSTKIEDYNQSMTKSRALELQRVLYSKVEKLLRHDFKRIYVCLGKNYLLATGLDMNRPKNVRIIEGGIGIKMKKLKEIINREN